MHLKQMPSSSLFLLRSLASQSNPPSLGRTSRRGSPISQICTSTICKRPTYPTSSTIRKNCANRHRRTSDGRPYEEAEDAAGLTGCMLTGYGLGYETSRIVRPLLYGDRKPHSGSVFPAPICHEEHCERDTESSNGVSTAENNCYFQ